MAGGALPARRQALRHRRRHQRNPPLPHRPRTDRQSAMKLAGGDVTSERFKTNAAHNQKLAAELRERVAAAALGGPKASRERHTSRGKLLPRDRVERLLDPGSAFLEVG